MSRAATPDATRAWGPEVRDILAVRLDAVGDVLMTTPAIRALRSSPGRSVTLLTSNAGAEVAGVPARPANARVGDEPSSDATVSAVVRATFQLPHLPAAAAGPQQIPGWDSLGALKLLLALEEAFGITLAEQDMVKATSIAQLEAVVQAALQRASVRG